MRAYVIRSGGVRVNITGVYAVSLLTPYASIEQAIPSLTLSPTSAFSRPAGPARPAAARWSTVSGKLRFAGEAPLEVSARDGQGRLVRLREERTSDGAQWSLPAGRAPLFLMARFAGGRLVSMGGPRARP